MKLKHRLLAVIPTLLVTGVLAAFASAATPVNVAFVGADLVDPYYLTMKCGAFDAAKKYNVKLSWQGTNGVDFQPDGQRRCLFVKREPRLEQPRVRQQREQRADVRDREEPVWLRYRRLAGLHRRMCGPSVPRLK